MASFRFAVFAGLLLVAAIGSTSAVEFLKSQEQLDELIAEVWTAAFSRPLHFKPLFLPSASDCSLLHSRKVRDANTPLFLFPETNRPPIGLAHDRLRYDERQANPDKPTFEPR